ncbi:MAG TPA: amidohydrolase family protein [Methylomirabilota bacterium]|nr:amidohydrolase family protein [Methylomirabilota bacterium]
MSHRSVFTARRVANPEMSAWLPDHAVLTEAGRIRAVVPRGELPGDVAATHRAHDLGDVSLLPGLVDVHAHMHCSATPDAYDLVTTESHEALCLRAATNLRSALLSGVTTLRDLGSRNEVAFPVRDAVRRGVIPGPRLVLAGTPITTTAGHCWMFGTEADTLDQVVAAVRRQKKLGAECVKVMATGGMFTPTANPRSVQYPVETLRAAVQEAERLDMQLAAHTLSARGVRNCVEAGVHHLVHARWLSADPRKGLEYDPAVADRMAASGQLADVTFGLHLLAEEAAAAGAAPARSHWAVAAAPVSLDEHVAVTRDMHARGVRFLTGLDMGMAHCRFDASAASARAFVKWFGYTPWQALAASTVESAAALRLGREVGAIRPGLAADLVAVAGDPAADIAALGHAVDVVQAGRPVKLGGRTLV